MTAISDYRLNRLSNKDVVFIRKCINIAKEQTDIQEKRRNEREFERLVKENEKFIYNIIRNIVTAPSMESLCNLFQIGQEALLKAVEKFDSDVAEDRGSSFSTYAYRIIYNDVLREVEEENGFEKPSVFSIEDFKRQGTAARSFENYEFDYIELDWKSLSRGQDNITYDMETIITDQLSIQQECSQFSDIEKKAIILLFQSKKTKMTHNDIAEELGLDYKTFKNMLYNNLHHKLKKIQKYIDKWDEFSSAGMDDDYFDSSNLTKLNINIV